VSASSKIRFSATSCSVDRYVTTALFGLPKAFLTARNLSSSFGRANLADTAGGLVGERSGDNASMRRPCGSGGDTQKLSLPQLLEVDAVDAVADVAGVRGGLGVLGVLGVAGTNGFVGRERTDVIEQSLDVEMLATEAPREVEPTSPLGGGIVISDNDDLDRFAGGVCPSSAHALRLSSPKKLCHDSLSGLNVWMFLSLRCLTMSLGTAYLFTPMADPRPAEVFNGSSNSTSGSSTSLFSAW
jgi:hypothetical protein